MTRYTDFARKRTYVQAGLNYRDGSAEDDDAARSEHVGSGSDHIKSQSAQPVEPSDPPKKRRKKDPSKRRKSEPASTEDGPQKAHEAKETGVRDAEAQGDEDSAFKAEVDEDGKRKRSRGAIRAERRRIRDAQARKEASGRRRLKRKDQRNADTICFACREKGHAARDCTQSLRAPEEGDDAIAKARARKSLAKSAVGLCYRCGSREHNLSKCTAPVDSLEPLPLASCFVCSGKGHLASTCPQNQAKGVYPNGGCCKLCGEITHLAKDCGLRKKVEISTSAVLGTGTGAGADEDDFHAIKRRTVQVDKSEKVEGRLKRQAKVKVGVYSGAVRAFGTKPGAPRKIIHF